MKCEGSKFRPKFSYGQSPQGSVSPSSSRRRFRMGGPPVRTGHPPRRRRPGWVPPVREVLVAGVDHCLGSRREHGDGFPDGGTGEPRHGLDAKPGGCPGGILHGFRRPAAYAFRFAVAPDFRGQDALVAFIDGVIADSLAGQVVGDSEDFEVVLLKDVQPALEVVVVLGSAAGVQVVAPAGDLQPVKAPLAGKPRHFLKGQVGPLAGEQRDWSCHVCSLVPRSSVSLRLFATGWNFRRWTPLRRGPAAPAGRRRRTVPAGGPRRWR